MIANSRIAVLIAMGALMAGACQSAAQEGTPARLQSQDARTLRAVRAVLADAMGEASVELGPGAEGSTISVLPPPLGPNEDRSTAKPTQFDIVIKGDDCFLIRRDTGEEFALNGVSCRAVGG